MRRLDAQLVLADGTLFEGYAAGYLPASGITTGEFVFNTSTSGYQEVITDPSYAGQIIAFTYPHIGNYGVTPLDDEAERPWCRGVVIRELSELPSNWRSHESLEAFLVRHEIPVIVGVDTRRLTRHLRANGALPGAFGHGRHDSSRPPRRPSAQTGVTTSTEVSTTRSTNAATVTCTSWPLTTASNRRW